MFNQRKLLTLVLFVFVLALSACDSARQPPATESSNSKELQEHADSESEATSDIKGEGPGARSYTGPSEADLDKTTLAEGKVLVIAHNPNDFVVELTVDGIDQGEVDANAWSTMGLDPGEHSFFARAKNGRGYGVVLTISGRRFDWYIGKINW